MVPVPGPRRAHGPSMDSWHPDRLMARPVWPARSGPYLYTHQLRAASEPGSGGGAVLAAAGRSVGHPPQGGGAPRHSFEKELQREQAKFATEPVTRSIDTRARGRPGPCLVETAARAWRDGEPPARIGTHPLRLAAWRAGRSGLGGPLLHPETMKGSPVCWSGATGPVSNASPCPHRATSPPP